MSSVREAWLETRAVGVGKGGSQSLVLAALALRVLRIEFLDLDTGPVVDKSRGAPQELSRAEAMEMQTTIKVEAAWDTMVSLEYVLGFHAISKVLDSENRIMAEYTDCLPETRDRLMDYWEAYIFLRGTGLDVKAMHMGREKTKDFRPFSQFDKTGDRLWQMLAAAAFARKAPCWNRRASQPRPRYGLATWTPGGGQFSDPKTVLASPNEIFLAAAEQAIVSAAWHDACFLLRCCAEYMAQQSSRGHVTAKEARELEASIARPEAELGSLIHAGHMSKAAAAARRAVFSAGGVPRTRAEIAELQWEKRTGKTGSELLDHIMEHSGRSYSSFPEFWYDANNRGGDSARVDKDREVDTAPTDWKKAGNEAFKRAEFGGAYRLYSTAIDHHRQQSIIDEETGSDAASASQLHVLYSNRAAACLGLAKDRPHERVTHSSAALADALHCIELEPSFQKGYYRRAVALQSLGSLTEARTAFQAVVTNDWKNEAAQASLVALDSDIGGGGVQAPPISLPKLLEVGAVRVDVFKWLNIRHLWRLQRVSLQWREWCREGLESRPQIYSETQAAEGGSTLFDLATLRWKTCQGFCTDRRETSMCVLSESQVVTLGGSHLVTGSVSAAPTATAELHGLAGSETIAPMAMRRKCFGACALSDGCRVIVSGGESPFTDSVSLTGIQRTDPTDTVELFDLRTGAWKSLPPMLSKRSLHFMIALPDDRVLVAGGQGPEQINDDTALSSAELFDPVKNKWERLPAMHDSRWAAAVCLTADGDVLVTGGSGVQGSNGVHGTKSCELFRVATCEWQRMADMVEERIFHGCVLVGSDVFVLHGESDMPDPGVEMLDAELGRWVRVADTIPELADYGRYVETGGSMVATQEQAQALTKSARKETA
jgi:hypothetical protein